MQLRNYLTAVSLAACCAYAADAHAHVCMDKPVSRVGPNCTFASAQKPGPCGINTRSTQYVTTFKPGETITVELNETVDHPSHYRIAFNPNGSTFEDPTSKDDKTSGHPFVLLDNIMDTSAAKQSVQVTLPNMTCDNCTLQLIQVMYDKGGNGFGNDDIYYSCADIVLKGTPSATPDGGAAADAGTKSDASAGDPARPLPSDASTGIPPVDLGGGGAMGGDSGSGAPLPPADAGQPPVTQVDAAVTGTAGGGGTTGGSGATGGAHDHDPEDEDDSSCAMRAGALHDTDPLQLVAGLGVALLLLRRRRRR